MARITTIIERDKHTRQKVRSYFLLPLLQHPPLLIFPLLLDCHTEEEGEDDDEMGLKKS